MVIRHNKLPPMQCYHIFSDTRDVGLYLSKNCYEHYSPRMVPVAEISGSGSWPITPINLLIYSTTITLHFTTVIIKRKRGNYIKHYNESESFYKVYSGYIHCALLVVVAFQVTDFSSKHKRVYKLRQQ